ncbi:hypothetical protein D3C75_1336540 [compost metagenome]
MTKPCNQGQRHGVGDFGTDQAAGDQIGIEQKQRHRAQGAGTDGRQRDHDP